MRAAGSFLVNFTFAEGAKTRRLLRSFFFFVLLGDIIDFIDQFHNEEKAYGDCGKIDNCLQEQAIRDFGCADHPFHVAVVGLLGNQRKQRHNHAVDQRIDDCGKGSADDHTYGKVDYIAFKCKCFEFLPDFFHAKSFPSVDFLHYITLFRESLIVTVF